MTAPQSQHRDNATRINNQLTVINEYNTEFSDRMPDQKTHGSGQAKFVLKSIRTLPDSPVVFSLKLKHLELAEFRYSCPRVSLSSNWDLADIEFDDKKNINFTKREKCLEITLINRLWPLDPEILAPSHHSNNIHLLYI